MDIDVHFPDATTAVLSVDRWPADAERKARSLGVALRHRIALPVDFDPAPYPALRISVPAMDPPLLLLLAPRQDLAQAVETALDTLAANTAPISPQAPTPGYL